MERIKVRELLKLNAGVDVQVKGWVRTKRGNKNISFVALNDGSTINNIQIVFDMSNFSDEQLKDVTTGACICVEGSLVASVGSRQAVEIQAKKLILYGSADPEKYPLQKKGHSMEFLREIGHLRPRTNTFGAILRIRHAMAFAIHR
ncbi:MAG TPA: OB-fold nucleic acid binding domain-containing protein, partial [Bacteroidales bacterium]|nr:OB-fold nucleic acid binding domain-containing protein [Bacteroidales bacterium]